MDKRNKRFMGPVAGVTAALGVMMGSGYVALSTDAFIDVGEVTQLAGADTSIYNQQDMRRESQQYLFGIFQNVEEEKIEEDNSSTDGAADSAADNTYSGDSVYDSSGTSATVIGEVTDADIAADIANGLYTQEDYSYLVALGAEATDYEGFYAVACSVRNRVQTRGLSYKAIVSDSSQYSGYHTEEIGNPRNDDIKRAAVAVLRGGASTVGDAQYFFGRVEGYDLWYSPSQVSSTPVVVGTGINRNVFYNPYGSVHNKLPSKTADAVVLWDCTTKTWK